MIKVHGRKVEDSAAVGAWSTTFKILKPRPYVVVDFFVFLSVVALVSFVVTSTIQPPALFTCVFDFSGIGPPIEARLRK